MLILRRLYENMSHKSNSTYYMKDKILSIPDKWTAMLAHFKGCIKKLYDYFLGFIHSAEHFKDSFKNISRTNIDLGIYHLTNGNIKDAIIRFILVDKLFAPGNEEARYYLGWAYFINGDTNKALDYLQQSTVEDAKNLVWIMTKPDYVEYIPDNVLYNYREFTTDKISHKWEYERYIPNVVITELFNTIEELPKDCAILDIGSNFGEIGAEIDKKLEKHYTLTGVENMPIMIESLKNIDANKRKIYDVIVDQSVSDFLKNTPNQSKYDIIISLSSLSFTKNLTEALRSIHGMLKPQGYVVIVLPMTSNNTYLDLVPNEFLYNKHDVLDQMKSSNLAVVSTTNVNLNRFKSYAIFIATNK